MLTRHNRKPPIFLSVMLFLVLISASASAQTSSFTYQGKLSDGGIPASGNYDLQFTLWDSVSGGTQVGTPQTVSTVAVSNGIFTVSIDFGASAFPGANRFLEIGARVSGGGSFTVLSPRQQITSTMYAVRSLNAGGADSLTSACAGCVTDTNINSVAGSKVSGALPVSAVPGGSGSYIQNTTTTQAGSNFNISGNGTAGGTLSGNTINTTTQYNLGGSSILRAPGQSTLIGRLTGNGGSLNTNSLFGFQAGSNTTGDFNSFFGRFAGVSNQSGSSNTFFGDSAGQGNIAGTDNSFFGTSAGYSNKATGNSFFGSGAGFANVSGTDNAFFGFNAGAANTASRNSFFGSGAGQFNSTGAWNAFFGYEAGKANTESANSFFGAQAGTKNNTGNYNAFFGSSAGFNNLSGFSNSFFGSDAGENNQAGHDNSFFGRGAGLANTASSNSFFGSNAGVRSTVGTQNAFFGLLSGENNLTGNNNTFIGYDAGNPSLATQVSDSTAIGSGAAVATSNTIVLGRSSETTQIPGKFMVGDNSVFPPRGDMQLVATSGNADFYMQAASATKGINFGVNSSSPNSTLYISQYDGTTYQDRLIIGPNGTVFIPTLGAAGSTNLCRNASNEIGTCSSSLRYKKDVRSFRGGLNIINRLRPISFSWKQGGLSDIGLGAEEVEQVEPLLTFRNDKGEIEGVKYNQLSAVFINAFKEQQAQIQQQQEQIKQQQRELDALKRLVCGSHRRAVACR